MSLFLATGAAFTASVLTAGAASATTAAPGTSAADPYSPAYQHSYRHGVLPTIQQNAKMKTWAATQATPQVTGPETLSYGGGIDGIGVMDGHAKVYLVFDGTQWGTQSTDGNGNLTFSGDPYGGAPVAQQMFKGIGTGNELWSADLTQWCDGPNVSVGATSCPANASFVPYQSGGVLAGVWYDNSGPSPAAASGHQLGQEAVNAAGHFGNTTAAANRDAYYVILSPHNTNPDDYQGQYCAWHDYNGDSTLTGGPVTSPYGDIAFSNQPYNMDSGAGCGVGFVNSPGTLDGYTITMGHEWHETMSDQNPAGGWTNNTGSAYDGEENSDECAWISPGSAGGAADVTMGNGTYAEQASWSNDTNACSISHPIVGGQPSSGAVRAIHGPNGDLWAGPSGGTDLGQAMKAGTSPSIATLSTGGKEIAYQGGNGDLWVTTISGTPIDSHLGMMNGTSPAIAAAASGGFNVAFQANTGYLWDYTSATGRGTSLNQPMVTTSSPSITAPVGTTGGYEIAYQGSNVDLWVTTISGTPIDSHLGMMNGTSPAIAAAPGSGFNVAFQANTGYLWDYTSTTGRGTSLNQAMTSGTSPGLAQ
ncbi:MAG TPA: hypothetical protein VGX23_19350 [Actinocrinis sp.]|nr:hypothetical protein [Actinocrinis sp.]